MDANALVRLKRLAGTSPISAVFASRAGSWVDHRQCEYLFEWIEVAIPVQKRMTIAKAEGSDYAIDGLPHRMASLAELPEIPSRRDSQFRTPRLEYLEPAEFALDSCE